MNNYCERAVIINSNIIMTTMGMVLLQSVEIQAIKLHISGSGRIPLYHTPVQNCYTLVAAVGFLCVILHANSLIGGSGVSSLSYSMRNRYILVAAVGFVECNTLVATMG